MKKLKKAIIIILIFSNILITNYIYADDILDDVSDEENMQINIEEISAEPTKIPTINSRAAVIYDRTSKTVLYGKNENTKRPMASTTKIMTSIIVLEKANLSDVVEVSKKAAGTGGSRLGLKTGDKVTVLNLLYGLLLVSGNDAAVALAEHVGGSITEFAELMNNKAKELGLNSTSFVTPHGLDADEHYTTAYELAIIADYALNIKEFSNIVDTKNYTVYINQNPKNITNTNELLGNLSGVYGVKTGFTNGANRCLVTSCKRGDMDIICVVLGADTKKYRTQDSARLIEYAFTNFEMVDLKDIVEKEFRNYKNNNYINVIKGESEVLEYGCEIENIGSYPILKEELQDITIQINTIKETKAPICLDQEVGKLMVLVENKEILTTKIMAKESINKKRVHNYFLELISGYNKLIEESLNGE